MEPIGEAAFFIVAKNCLISQGIMGLSPGRSERTGDEGARLGVAPGTGRTYEPTGDLDCTALQKASMACGLPSRMAVMKDGSGTACWPGLGGG